jgi:hypothetical protein
VELFVRLLRDGRWWLGRSGRRRRTRAAGGRAGPGTGAVRGWARGSGPDPSVQSCWHWCPVRCGACSPC